MIIRNKKVTSLFLIFIFLFLSVSVAKPITAQGESNAEIVVNLDETTIPSIQKNWTAINFTVIDFFGLNWDYIKKHFTIIQQRLIWPVLFQIKDIKRYLGYTSLSFEVEAPPGWTGKVIPASIEGTTTNYVHNLTLYLQVTDLASEYSPTIKIKCTRYDVLGGEYGITYMTLPVKAAALNFAFVTPLEPTKKAAPKSIIYFPIQITNKGEYRGNYEFSIETESDILGMVSQQSLLLEPGETKVVQLGIRTPEMFYDIGTPRNIRVVVSPIGSPSNQFVTNIIVITEGFYISPLITGGIIIFIILALIIYFLFFYLRNKREQELFGKPEKPWRIPEEKTYLQDLKQNDKTAYELERKMMQDEYHSAMLWYRDYRDSMRQKPVEEKSMNQDRLRTKLSGLLKRPEKKTIQKEKQKKKPPVLPKKSAEKIKEEAVAVKPLVPIEDTNKEKALAKIKKEQEKQLRKLK